MSPQECLEEKDLVVAWRGVAVKNKKLSRELGKMGVSHGVVNSTITSRSRMPQVDVVMCRVGHVPKHLPGTSERRKETLVCSIGTCCSDELVLLQCNRRALKGKAGRKYQVWYSNLTHIFRLYFRREPSHEV